MTFRMADAYIAANILNLENLELNLELNLAVETFITINLSNKDIIISYSFHIRL